MIFISQGALAKATDNQRLTAKFLNQFHVHVDLLRRQGASVGKREHSITPSSGVDGSANERTIGTQPSILTSSSSYERGTVNYVSLRFCVFLFLSTTHTGQGSPICFGLNKRNDHIHPSLALFTFLHFHDNVVVCAIARWFFFWVPTHTTPRVNSASQRRKS